MPIPHSIPHRFIRLVAVVHDHFINYRMDLDIDGPANSFVESKMVKQRLPESELRKTVYQVGPYSTSPPIRLRP